MFCSLEVDGACGVSAPTACAAVVDSPPTGDDSDAGCCGCELVSPVDSLEAEVGCPAVASALAVPIPAFGPFKPGPKASVSLFDTSPCLFAANTLSGIGLGSTAGPPSVWGATTFVVSNASAGAVEPSGLCTQPTSEKASAKTVLSAGE